MGLMDKVKAQAEQAMVKGQQAAKQGQAKLEAYQQSKHGADALLRDLGSAVYAQQRSGGSQEAVDAALAALDQHYADQAAAQAAAQAADPSGGSAPSAAAAGTEAPPPAGGFTIDNV